MDKKQKILEELISFYKGETFFDEHLDDGLLHKSCKHKDSCWKKASDQDADWNYFSLPYIGDNYTGELLCVGLNVHKGGGRNLQDLQIRGYEKGIEDNCKELAETYSRIMYMDAIKCSPANSRSKPTGKMIGNCPEYIFFKELEIIKPANILILHKSTAGILRKKYSSGKENFPKEKYFDCCEMEIAGREKQG